MKKTILIIASASLLVLGSLAVAWSINRNASNTMFEANVEALAGGEEGIYGFCDETSPEPCMGRCPVCNQLIYAQGHYGPARDFTGTCNH